MWWVVLVIPLLVGCGQVDEAGSVGVAVPVAASEKSIEFNDVDEDGVANHVDNCVTIANSKQYDTDRDGEGNACDVDIDGDGFANEVDPCPYHSKAQDEASIAELGMCYGDYDGDGWPDERDNCPMIFNDDQADFDEDGFGDACSVQEWFDDVESPSTHDAVEAQPDLRSHCELSFDASVSDAAGVQALLASGACMLEGDLILEASELIELHLPLLREIRGDVRIERNAELETVQLPALTRVHGDMYVAGNAQLYLLDLTALQLLGGVGGLVIEDHARLPIVHLPQLTELHGTLALLDNAALHTVAFPSLVSLGGLEFSNLAQLEQLRFAALEHVHGEVYVGRNAHLRRVSFDALEEIGTSLQLYGLERLEQLHMPQLHRIGAGVVRFEGNLFPGISFASSNIPLLSLPVADQAFVDSGVFELLKSSGQFPQLQHVDGAALLQ